MTSIVWTSKMPSRSASRTWLRRWSQRHVSRFPPRNRIVAGLAAAVIVVETPVTGGALITAARALDYGLPVLAVPGDIDRETSVGCNLLIRDGAHPVFDAADLTEELDLMLGTGVPSGEDR